jgi:cobalt-precorrin-5B (C1)-methyltransferase
MNRRPEGELRRGWTTGACATAAATAAYTALLSGAFPDPVTVHLPNGLAPAFALAREETGEGFARAAVVKDAGDDPDVTHGALVVATVRKGAPGSGVTFKAGAGVGTVTLPGLPLSVGEPAINPMPREMMRAAVARVAAALGDAGDVEIEISIPDGAALAKKTWNPRLGIAGGLSILGTTGVVIPFSCSAWIHSIHRGIDVARANNLSHVAACTGSTTERIVQDLYGLPDIAMLDMGDFAGGLLKYLRTHPLPRLTIGGGFGKLCKLGAGHLDLHSGRSQVGLDWLAETAKACGGDASLVAAVRTTHSAANALVLARAAGVPLGDAVAARARRTAVSLVGNEIAIEVIAIDRSGQIAGRAGG